MRLISICKGCDSVYNEDKKLPCCPDMNYEDWCLEEDYHKLKQSADEMANSLKKYMIGTEIEFEVVAALENYKKLI